MKSAQYFRGTFKYTKAMSERTHLSKIFHLLWVFFSFVCSETRSCSSYNTSDFYTINTTAKNIAFGDCSFTKDLCSYEQVCTDRDAMNWTIINGSAVCPGKSGLFDSFSILVSPLLNVKQNTSLSFNFYQKAPGALSVFTITSANIKEVLPERQGVDGNFQELLFIGPSTLKIGFKARSPDDGFNVTLSNIKLQVASYTPTINHMTTMATSPPYSQPVTHVSTQADHVTTMATSLSYSQSSTHVSTQAGHMTTMATTPSNTQPANHFSSQRDNPEAAEDKGGNNAAVVAGVLVPVVVVVAVVVVGVFIWRRRRQQLHRNPKKGVTRDDTTDMSPFVLGAGSSNSSLAIDFKNSPNSKNKSAHEMLHASNTHYDIPRNTESCRPAAHDSPSAGDDDHDYDNLEDKATAAEQQTSRSVYSYEIVEKPNSSESNNLDADYNRIVSAEARRRGQSEAGYDPVEDDYSHISSTDTVARVGPQAAASRPTGWNESTDLYSTAVEVDSTCDQHTSRESEDDYSVVSAGNKQFKTLNDQRSEGAEKAHSHLTSSVEGDYDRIRREDREDVPGCDYDHVGRHTRDDYDQVGQRDKTKIIGNDYDHLV